MPKEGERGRLGQKEGDFDLLPGRNAKEGDEVKKRESPSKRGRVDRYGSTNTKEFYVISITAGKQSPA